VIQGDGVNERTIAAILDRLAQRGFSADNIAFGMGGELLQTVNRDTLQFAMKANAIKTKIHSEWNDVFKAPVTDPGKISKKGRLALVLRDDQIVTVREAELHAGEENLLEDVYVDGKLLRRQNFADIRARAAQYG
jgi:nicotinamide phosphoribosyltransferase